MRTLDGSRPQPRRHGFSRSLTLAAGASFALGTAALAQNSPPPIDLPESAPATPATPPPAVAAPAPAQPAPAQPVAAAPGPDADPTLDGVRGTLQKYPVSRFLLRYKRENEGNADLAALADIRARVGVASDGGFIRPRDGVPTKVIRIGDEFPDGTVFYPSGIGAVSDAIVQKLKDDGLLGIYTQFDSDDIDDVTGADKRRDNRTLRLVVWTGVVVDTKSISVGPSVDSDERVNNERAVRIRDKSPVTLNSVIRKDLLDDYVLRLNRHPGRRVDVAVVPAGEAGEVELQYLVNEAKRWAVYAQLSNTGTESTSAWRERFGFFHNNLTNSDDILRLEYLTATFDRTNALSGSYERPLWDERTRGRIFSGWNEYVASDVGFVNARFEGQGFNAGVEVIRNVYQSRELFIDLIGGIRYETSEVNNEIVNQSGREDFVIPSIGTRLDRQSDAASLSAGLSLEAPLSDLTNVKKENLTNLGRIDADERWVLLKFDGEYSFYLEPLLNSAAYSGRTDEGWTSLSHELYFSVRGQYAFNNRLVPTQQQVMGGFYSVRGYPESIVVGDSAIIATAEYRFHLPRILPRRPEAGTFLDEPFRWAPQQAFGRTDWDLIFRGFFDAARADISDRITFFETDESLASTGVGIEFQFRNNFSIRLDYGYALKGLEGNSSVEAGDTRLHFSATILY
jgi:hemolysin activation/secretion protein